MIAIVLNSSNWHRNIHFVVFTAGPFVLTVLMTLIVSLLMYKADTSSSFCIFHAKLNLIILLLILLRFIVKQYYFISIMHELRTLGNNTIRNH